MPVSGTAASAGVPVSGGGPSVAIILPRGSLAGTRNGRDEPVRLDSPETVVPKIPDQEPVLRIERETAGNV